MAVVNAFLLFQQHRANDPTTQLCIVDSRIVELILERR